MKAQDLMTPSPIHVTPRTPLPTCALLLARHRIRHLPVTGDDQQVLGIVTDTAVSQRGSLLPDGGWLSELPADTSAADVMAPAESLGPYAPVSAVLDHLAVTRSDVVLVCADGSRLLGIITEHDGVRLAQGVLSEDQPAWQPPRRTLHTIHRTRPAAEALAEMLRVQIRHMLVTDDKGLLRGVISMRDLIEDLAQSTEPGMAIDAVVRQPNVVAISPETPAAQAARLMVRLRIGCLPVLGDNNALVGVVSRTDILRQLARALRAEGS